MLSLVIPVYRNEASIDRLCRALEGLAARAPVPLEVVFVVDASPDRSHELLRQRLPRAPYAAQLVLLSRNVGSFTAILVGLEKGRGDYFATLAADLQEPPDLALRFLETLRRGEADVTFGVRASRSDPWSALASRLFWFLYRKLVMPALPAGGVDTFGCTRAVRDRLLAQREVDTNLIALLLWLGYRPARVPYDRLARREGTSAWTLAKKVRYGADSVFGFTNLPARILLGIGGAAILAALALAPLAGSPSLALAILFLGGVIGLGLGVVSQYLWLVLRKLRGRPADVVASAESFPVDPTAERARSRRAPGRAAADAPPP